MFFCGILALSVIIANLTIIIVILRNRQFPTCQLIYKLSLAFADVLVGIFVLPSFITSLYLFHVGAYQRKTEVVNYFQENNKNLTTYIYQFDMNANIYYKPEISSAYLNFFGFITSFSFFNSAFILMFASIDRYNSLSNPLRYKKYKATLNAKRFTIGLYFVSFIFALLPIAIPELGHYQIMAGGVLISVISKASAYLIGLAMSLPLTIMWIFTICVMVNLKRQSKIQKQFLPKHQKHDFTTEKQLFKTLLVMIGVFTICILPGIPFAVTRKSVPSFVPNCIKQATLRPEASFLSIKLTIAIILASNSLWNAFIYAFRNKQFRKDAIALYYATASVLTLRKLRNSIFDCVSFNFLRYLFGNNTRKKHFSKSVVAVTAIQNATYI